MKYKIFELLLIKVPSTVYDVTYGLFCRGLDTWDGSVRRTLRTMMDTHG
jgi:hypothetical protein